MGLVNLRLFRKQKTDDTLAYVVSTLTAISVYKIAITCYHWPI